MKNFFKGFGLQLIINSVLLLLRFIVDLLILKYAPNVPPTTSFAKDSGWQIWSICSIIVYNIISIIVSIAMIFNKKNTKQFAGIGIFSILFAIYTYMCLR